jgi:hypothetical protein
VRLRRRELDGLGRLRAEHERRHRRAEGGRGGAERRRGGGNELPRRVQRVQDGGVRAGLDQALEEAGERHGDLPHRGLDDLALERGRLRRRGDERARELQEGGERLGRGRRGLVSASNTPSS